MPWSISSDSKPSRFASAKAHPPGTKSGGCGFVLAKRTIFESVLENIQNPHAPVNLIEQKDAMRLLIRLVEKSIAGVFHGVYPDHSSREKYYSAAAKQRGLEPPIFDQTTNSKNSKGKEIDVKQTCLLLNFKFLHQP